MDNDFVGHDFVNRSSRIGLLFLSRFINNLRQAGSLSYVEEIRPLTPAFFFDSLHHCSYSPPHENFMLRIFSGASAHH
jgi:hypothetical protein